MSLRLCECVEMTRADVVTWTRGIAATICLINAFSTWIVSRKDEYSLGTLRISLHVQLYGGQFHEG